MARKNKPNTDPRGAAMKDGESAGSVQSKESTAFKRAGNRKNGGSASSKRGNARRSDERQRGGGGSSNRAELRAPASNPIEWYNKHPDLLVASASLPFPNRPGMDLFKNAEYGSHKYIPAFKNVPGVMVLDWVPAVGESQDNQSPISLAARDIFSRVRSAFSGSIEADAPDFVIHFMALDSIFSYLSWLKRVYRVVNTFTPENLNLPNPVLRAMGFSEKQCVALRRDRMKLFSHINELCYNVQQFKVPNVYPVIERHSWMNTNIYLDADSVAAQMYLFNQTHFMRFETNASTKVGQVRAIALQPSSLSEDLLVDDLFDFGQELIGSLVAWDDVFKINGYLERAYEHDAMYTVAPLELEEKQGAFFDPIVLSQIENATIPAGDLTPNQVISTITQEPSTNAIIATVTTSKAAGTADPNVNMPLNFHLSTVTAADVVEATRLHCDWIVSGGNWKPVSYATEVVWEMAMYVDGVRTLMRTAGMLVGSISGSNYSVAAVNLRNLLGLLSLVSTFDWHPLFAVPLKTVEDNVFDYAPFGDIQNANYVDRSALNDINRMCLYSMFNSFSF